MDGCCEVEFGGGGGESSSAESPQAGELFEDLADALTHLLSEQSREAAPLVAGAAMLALDVAIERWQELQGEEDLGELIHQAFTTLEQLGTLR